MRQRWLGRDQPVDIVIPEECTTRMPETTATDELLAIFDKMRSWPGIVFLAERVGMSRQAVSKQLLKHRRSRYLKLRHPSRGRRSDLHG